MIIRNSLGDALEYEEILPSSAKGVTRSLFESANRPVKGMIIDVQDADVNYTLDGTTPTTTATTDDGHPLTAGDNITIEGTNNVRNFLCIDQAGASRVKITLFY